MKNKVLIIPDVHGLDFWEKPCNEWKGIIIFLGDYVDPYYPTTQIEALENLKKIVEFSKNTKCTCRFLIGNHDWSYITGFAPCRFDYSNQKEIKSLIEKLNPVLCTYVKQGNTTYLFSHAGFTNGWLEERDFKDREFTVPNEYKEIKERLNMVPYSRGGYSLQGSCIWNSLEDFTMKIHNEGCLENVYQIFGHTWGGRDEPVVCDDFAMLDCHKAFTLDLKSGEIKEYI